MSINDIMKRVGVGENLSLDTDVKGSGNNSSESYSLSELKESFLKKVKFSALSESSDDFKGPVPALSNRIIELKDKVVDFVTRCEDVDTNNLGAMYDLSNRRDNIIKEVNSVSTVLNNSDKQLNDHYQETLANSILAVMSADDEVKAKDLTEHNVEDIVEKDKSDIENCKDCNPTVGNTVEKNYDKVEKSLELAKKNLVYEPIEDPNGRVHAAEKQFSESKDNKKVAKKE